MWRAAQSTSKPRAARTKVRPYTTRRIVANMCDPDRYQPMKNWLYPIVGAFVSALVATLISALFFTVRAKSQGEKRTNIPPAVSAADTGK